MDQDKYLPELMAEKDSLDPSFVHAMRLLAEEIEKYEGDELRKDGEVQKYLDVISNKNIKLCERVLIPVQQYPKVMLYWSSSVLSCPLRGEVRSSTLSNPCEREWMSSCVMSSASPTLTSGLFARSCSSCPRQMAELISKSNILRKGSKKKLASLR
ncbi:hypothetical protein AAFF_G00174410 [Aldrovandia affinis]|uniref:KHDRBS Qua1 domain-containing protein n=1 Tax=Aldrovandia affinis TaxID=143900 RepID=A0AAD7RLG2_9TELE|nr:hypothetical protein AAFF_G00174410 [Aldrovandia affinis]